MTKKKNDNEMKPIDIQCFGDYRIGLTREETEQYVIHRSILKGGVWRKKKKNTITKQFWELMGVGTCGVGPQGQCLIYRHDVLRFANQMFDGIETYWD